MKKTNLKTRLLSTSLALLMLLSLTMQALTSCAKKEKEDGEFEDKLGISELSDMEKVTKLIDLTNKYYDKALKQTSSVNLTMSGKMMGVDFESSGTIKQTEIADLTAEAPGHMRTEESHMTTIVGSDEPVEQISKEMSGYADGYMYLAIIPDNDEARATYKKTPCEFEDYSDLQEAKTANDPTSMEALFDLAEKHKVSQKDGKWVVSASGINTDADITNNEFLNSFITNAPCEFTVTDMSMKITFNGESGVAEKITFKMTMESAADASFDIDLSMDMSIKFSLPSGSENFTPEYFDLYDTDLDLFAKEKAMVANDALLESEGIAFSMGTASKVDYLNERNVWVTASSYSEETAIEYGVKDGNFVFCYTVNREGYDGSATQGKVLYDGTAVKAEVRGEGVHKQAMSQYDARATIFDSTLVHLSFNEEDVINASVVESGSGYGLMLQLGMNETIRALIESSSLDPDALTEFEQLVTFNFNGNDDLVSIDYVITYSQTINGVLYRVTTESSIYDITDSDLSFISK